MAECDNPIMGGRGGGGGGEGGYVRTVKQAIVAGLPAGSREAKLTAAIGRAYFNTHAAGKFASIADIRENLPATYTRAEVDAALIRLARQPSDVARIINIADRGKNTSRDNAGAVIIGGKQHEAISLGQPSQAR